MATKTETQISELKINYLTEAQYQEAVSNGEINENELYLTPSINGFKESKYIDGIAFDGSQDITHYARCNTSNLDVEKVVSKSDFSLLEGSFLIVTFSVSNTASEPTLNVNGTGAKAIKLDGNKLTSDNAKILQGDVLFLYRNNAFNIVACNSITNLKADIKSPVFTGSISLGRKSDSTVGENSFAVGNNVEASGQYSHCEGENTEASGSPSHAEGYGARATGDYSHAEGFNTVASGYASHAEGRYTEALDYQHVLGHYNDTSLGETGTQNGTTGTAFVIGNGTSSTKSNACRITYAGAVIGKAAYQSTGADFAELREWKDGNPNNEDRRGYFVTMDGLNIRIASSGDYICGIISANPSLIGNNDEDWMGRYVFDDFGAFVYEDYEEADSKTGEVCTYKKYKENPEYDPTRKYEFRADRPEWDYVGLCGVIHVRDDGTCEVNGFCKCGTGGIATKSDRGYRVLERVNDHIVKVLFYLTGEIF